MKHQAIIVIHYFDTEVSYQCMHFWTRENRYVVIAYYKFYNFVTVEVNQIIFSIDT